MLMNGGQPRTFFKPLTMIPGPYCGLAYIQDCYTGEPLQPLLDPDCAYPASFNYFVHFITGIP